MHQTNKNMRTKRAIWTGIVFTTLVFLRTASGQTPVVIIEPTPTPPPTSIQDPLNDLGSLKLRPEIVTAKAGDTVAKIAARYHLDPDALAKYNGLLVTSVLFPGRALKVPPTPPRIVSEIEQNVPSSCSFILNIGDKSDPLAVKMFVQWNTLRRSDENVEIWSCTEPIFPSLYRKRRHLSPSYRYSLQYLTIECDRARMSADNEIGYDLKGRLIDSKQFLFTSAFADPIVPSSFGEAIMKALCKRPQ